MLFLVDSAVMSRRSIRVQVTFCLENIHNKMFNLQVSLNNTNDDISLR